MKTIEKKILRFFKKAYDDEILKHHYEAVKKAMLENKDKNKKDFTFKLNLDSENEANLVFSKKEISLVLTSANGKSRKEMLGYNLKSILMIQNLFLFAERKSKIKTRGPKNEKK